MGLLASIRPSTFDMAESETTEITCGAQSLNATKQRTRYECSILIGIIHPFHLRDQVFPKFATYLTTTLEKRSPGLAVGSLFREVRFDKRQNDKLVHVDHSTELSNTK